MTYFLMNLKFLSYMTIILAIYLQETEGDQKGPGISSCDIVATNCDDTKFWDLYPDGCLSFVFSCILIDENHIISYLFEGAHNEHLDKLGQSGKKLYLDFGRPNYAAWTAILDCDGNNALKDAEAINSFTSQHKGITGLLLRNLEPAIDDTIEVVGLTQMVSKYIEVVKDKTGLEIAFTFASDDIQAYYEKPKISWLNFTVIDSCADFYVFGLYNFFSECTEKTSGRNTGVRSITGNGTYTLEKLRNAIEKSLIPINKIYYDLNLSPYAFVADSCIISYQTICVSPDKTVDWCSDTQEILFKQGQWFRQNGAGFIGGYVDFDDPEGVCKCGKYPAFNAILAGFNGTACVPACPLFDRTG